MSTFYLGQTTDGRIVSRKSTRSDFTHAAIANERNFKLPNFSTSAAGAEKLLCGSYQRPPAFEVVELRKVDGREYHAATKGIDPITGRAKTA